MSNIVFWQMFDDDPITVLVGITRTGGTITPIRANAFSREITTLVIDPIDLSFSLQPPPELFPLACDDIVDDFSFVKAGDGIFGSEVFAIKMGDVFLANIVRDDNTGEVALLSDILLGPLLDAEIIEITGCPTT